MNNSYSGPERRRSPRVRVEFTLIYRVDRPMEVRMSVGNKEVNALMLDLSELGLAILTDYDLPLSTALSIKFTLMNLYAYGDEQIRVMEISGEVRNNTLTEKNEHRLGILFTQITQEEKTAIAKFVRMALNR